MENIIWPFVSGMIVGALLWQCFWNQLLIKNTDDWYELGYKHGKQRGDADAFLEKINQQYKD